ncbi:MAG: hypothetical protein J7J20_06925 [Desulfurococcales archaeon]|nr:hypothetical protein [Desulfurococcales archaeon]
MIWFSYLMTPLGPNLRVKGRAILDIGEVDKRLKNLAPVLPLKLESYKRVGIEELMLLTNIDPDVADLAKLGIRHYVILSYPDCT